MGRGFALKDDRRSDSYGNTWNSERLRDVTQTSYHFDIYLLYAIWVCIGQCSLVKYLEVELQDVLDVGIGREATVLPHEEGESIVTVNGSTLGQEDGVVEFHQLMTTQFLKENSFFCNILI